MKYGYPFPDKLLKSKIIANLFIGIGILALSAAIILPIVFSPSAPIVLVTASIIMPALALVAKLAVLLNLIYRDITAQDEHELYEKNEKLNETIDSFEKDLSPLKKDERHDIASEDLTSNGFALNGI